MHLFKKNPVFSTVLSLLGLVLAAGVVVLILERNNVEEVRRNYEDKVQEYERLLHHSPSLTRENLELVRQDLSNVEENLNAVRAALGAEADVAELFADVPGDSTEAFFDLRAFEDRYRELARSVAREDGEGVRIRDNETFGFSRYRSQGPPAQLIEEVYKQRQIAGYLLETLFAARPVELVRLRREDVAARHEVSAPGGGEADELFTIPQAMSARIPGFVETYPFQITFTGHTWVLRDFLNRLAGFELPVLVRSVEVESAAAARDGARRERQTPPGPASGTPQSAENGAVPIVSPQLNRFVVTVEFIELVSSDNNAGNNDAGAE